MMRHATAWLCATLCVLFAVGCAKDNAAMAGLNNKFDHLVEFQSAMRDDLKQYHEEGSTQDKRLATLLDEVTVEGGAVNQRVGEFRGQQNVGWFSGGGLWAAVVAVAAFFLLHEARAARRAKSAQGDLRRTLNERISQAG